MANLIEQAIASDDGDRAAKISKTRSTSKTTSLPALGPWLCHLRGNGVCALPRVGALILQVQQRTHLGFDQNAPDDLIRGDLLGDPCKAVAECRHFTPEAVT